MKDTTLLKANIKDKIIQNFSDIKKQNRNHRLYNFILNRVKDYNVLYLATSGTLKNMKDKIETKFTNYSILWLASEMNLTSKEYIPLQKGIVKKLKLLNQNEIDLLLIESLKELKNDGLFENEIPEFSVYIQDVENNQELEEYSFMLINGKAYLNHFKNRNLDLEISLTNLLLDKYNLR